MKGALPPSSIDTRNTFCADAAMSALPTAVDPVNDSLRSRSSAISGPVTPGASVVGMTLSTPAGRPASRITSVNNKAVRGVSSDGLSTMVHPAATAGPTLRVTMARGKFQGVIIRLGPTGRLSVSRRFRPSGAVVYDPPMRTASSENQRRNSAP